MSLFDEQEAFTNAEQARRMKKLELLWRAVEADDPDGVAEVAYGCDHKMPNVDGRTALMYAAYLGHSVCVEKLVVSHLEPDLLASDNLGRTALHWAAVSGDVMSVKHMRNAASYTRWDACFQRRDVDGKMALDIAMDHGHFAIVGEHLGSLLAPYQVEAIRANVLPRLHENVSGVLSAIAPHLQFRDVVGKHVASLSQEERDWRGNSPLHLAAMAGSFEAVEDMLAAGHNPHALNFFHATPLIVCAQDTEWVDDKEPWAKTAKLLAPVSDARWADLNGQTALMHAAMKSGRSTVEALIPFSDVNAMDNDGRTALYRAYKRGSQSDGYAGDLLEPLTRSIDYIRRGANKDIQGKNLRQFAEQGDAAKLAKMFDAERERIKAGKKLSEFAIDCNELPLALRQDQHGVTALMVAARHGHAACVEILLEHGADPLARDSFGQSALIFAATRGHLDCVRLLIPRSHVDAKTNLGQTALQIAAKGPNRAIFEELSKVARLDILNSDQ
jgi:ankyrin repeat protein